jgi:hypothetical protein
VSAIPPLIGQFGERDAEHVEVLWPVVLQGGAAGSFNWFSGVLSLDVDHAVWKARDGSSREYVRAARAYVHEYFHGLQLYTMSFPYLWAAELYALIQPVLKRFRTEDTDDFSGIVAIIQQGSQSLSEDERSSVREHFLRWDEASASGLTARAILEGQAYYVERVFLHDLDQVSDWTPHLHSAPTPTYRVAFDHLTFCAGATAAFRWFPLAASVALCTSHPADAFDRIAITLRDMRAGELDPRDESTAHDMMAALARPLIDLGVATAAEAWTLFRTGHPVLHETALRVNDADPGSTELFAVPQDHVSTMMKSVPPVVIFRPHPPHHLAIETREGMDEAETLVLFVVGAMGNQVCRDAAVAAEEVGERRIQRIEWLIRDHVPIMFTLSSNDLDSGEPNELARVLRLAEPREHMRGWGRLVLRLPDEVDPDQDVFLPTIPEARALLKETAQRHPAFPIFLHPQIGVLDWFGANADDDALGQDGTVDIAHPSMLETARSAALGIENFGQSAGQNVHLLAQALTATWG